LKRSNRLVLLIGVFLAIIAFVGILVLQGGGTKTDSTAPPKELGTVIATTDIPLGSRIQANQIKVEMKAVGARDAGALGDVSQAIGKIARQPVAAGAQITTTTFIGSEGEILDIQTPPTKRAIAVQVDQITGVGTVIKTGDYVDMVAGFTGDKFPVITLNPADDSFTVVSGLNSTSVKVLIQGMQVLGTLLPPPPAAAEANNTDTGTGTGTTTGGTATALNGQQQIVILAVDAQQAEIIKFAQLDGSISLLLRNADDFLDPTTGQPLPDGPVPDTTTGVILKSLVDSYGVIPPELVETVLPAQASPAP
jgi:pilus assembly protein CpaB